MGWSQSHQLIAESTAGPRVNSWSRSQHLVVESTVGRGVNTWSWSPQLFPQPRPAGRARSWLLTPEGGWGPQKTLENSHQNHPRNIPEGGRVQSSCWQENHS